MTQLVGQGQASCQRGALPGHDTSADAVDGSVAAQRFLVGRALSGRPHALHRDGYGVFIGKYAGWRDP